MGLSYKVVDYTFGRNDGRKQGPLLEYSVSLLLQTTLPQSKSALAYVEEAFACGE